MLRAARSPVAAGLRKTLPPGLKPHVPAWVAPTAARDSAARLIDTAEMRAAPLGFFKVCTSLLVAGTSLVALTPGEAAACGGFFCDNVNGVPQPVDQTGENILFVVDKAAGTVEAHIQIQYTGDPAEFAWVIPVTAIPDFSVGSELLFSNLLAGTVPTYSFTNTFDCQERDRSVGCASVELADGGSSLTGGVGEFGDETGDNGGPTIVKREIVGAYEIVVLQGGTAQELYDWLDDNGYAQDPDAPPILKQYLAEGFYFAAARLIHGSGVDELQPLVMTYKGDQPCVPLRLTRIAAMDNMPIRVFSLAGSRAVPTGYKHVEINEARLDWANFAANYTEVVRNAIDAPGTDGKAFVTEYAGPTSVVADTGLYDPRWNSRTFIDALPLAGDYSIVDALTSQGLMECFESDGCSYTHPLLLPILRTYLPAPAGVGEDDFYFCMSCFAEQIDQTQWDGPKFAQALEERIVAPGKHARDLLLRWPYLTRMLTIMSPEEMTRDPEFVFNNDLPEVPAARIATQMIPCAGSNKMELPDGEAVLLDDAGAWPTFEETMPWAREVQVIAPSGAPQVEQDFAEQIHEAVRASNKRYSYDNGTGLNCGVRRTGSSLIGALSLMVTFAFVWRRRRPRSA